MFCKACGHNNSTTALKCAACGSDIGQNEMLEMFQAQAQMSKGIDVSVSENPPTAPMEESLPPPVENVQAEADEFFSTITPAAPPVPEAPLTPPAPKPAPKVPKAPEEKKFFSKAEQGEEPMFETELGALRPEEEPKGPAEHPLYSPPSNPLIEEFIARRAAVRG